MQTYGSRRLHERWPIQLAAEVTSSGAAVGGRIQNLSLGGALLECAVPFPVGTGLRLSFRLPNGMPANATGSVVRMAAGPSEAAPMAIGVAFYGLDDVTREILRSYFDSGPARVEPQSGSVQMEEKFRVESDRQERIYLLLSGFLDKHECEILAQTMSEALAALRGSGVRLCIDASRYQCCTPTSVDYFKECFSLLGKRAWMAAALVGPKGVGMMQMRRAARDANVADAFASFDDVSEALEFLEAVQA